MRRFVASRIKERIDTIGLPDATEGNVLKDFPPHFY